MPSASPTTLEKIVEVVLLYSYFGAILHSKMTLYMAQGFSNYLGVQTLGLGALAERRVLQASAS